MSPDTKECREALALILDKMAISYYIPSGRLAREMVWIYGLWVVLIVDTNVIFGGCLGEV